MEFEIQVPPVSNRAAFVAEIQADLNSASADMLTSEIQSEMQKQGLANANLVKVLVNAAGKAIEVVIEQEDDKTTKRYRWKFTGGENRDYQGSSNNLDGRQGTFNQMAPGACRCAVQEVYLAPEMYEYSPDRYSVTWRGDVGDVYPKMRTYCGLASNYSEHISGLIGERWGRFMVALGCTMLLLLLPWLYIKLQTYFMPGEQIRDKGVQYEKAKTRPWTGMGGYYCKSLFLIIVAILAMLSIGFGSTCVSRYELVRQDELMLGDEIDVAGRLRQKWASQQSDFWKHEQYCGPAGEWGGWVMIVVGVLVVEWLAACYLCDVELRDKDFTSDKTSLAMDKFCGAKIGAVTRVWMFIILVIGIVCAPGVLFAVGVSCWDRNVNHCGSGSIGGQIMAAVGLFLVWLVGGAIFASKHLMDGDGTTLDDAENATTARGLEMSQSKGVGAYRDPSARSSDRLAASSASGDSGRRGGHGKCCHFAIGLTKFALLMAAVCFLAFGWMCEDGGRFCAFGTGYRNTIMITLGAILLFVVLLDVLTTGMRRKGGVLGLVGVMCILLILCAPLLIAFGAACVSGQDQFCGSGGFAGGQSMIAVGCMVILWAAAFWLALKLNGQDGGDSQDVGVNFCMSLVVLVVFVVLGAPIALVGVGVKCLTDGGTADNPSGWCLFTESASDFEEVGWAMVAIGAFVFMLEWCLLYYCRPREDPIPPSPPGTPDFPEAQTPPFYTTPPRTPPQEYKRLGPFLAWTKWLGGPSAGGPSFEETAIEGSSSPGHIRVDTKYRAGHWSSGDPVRHDSSLARGNAPVTIHSVEEALGSPSSLIDRDRYVSPRQGQRNTTKQLGQVARKLDNMR